jgi:hypothetical protein
LQPPLIEISSGKVSVSSTTALTIFIGLCFEEVELVTPHIFTVGIAAKISNHLSGPHLLVGEHGRTADFEFDL